MASDLGSLGRVTAADRLPTTGPGLVEYVGGRRAAVQALSGMDGPPARGNYKNPDAYAAARNQWRSASRRVQRWTATEGKQRRGQQRVTLPPTARRRAQAANRRDKRSRLATEGMKVSLTGLVTAGRDSRVRTIGKWSPVVIPPAATQRILDAYRAGDYDAAEEELWEAFCDELGWDADDDYFGVSGGSWAASA